VKDRKTIDERPAVQREPSTIPPVPYHPNLKLALNSVTASILLTYLETHHPAPPAAPGRLSSLPVTIDLDQVAQDLQLSRRTLMHQQCKPPWRYPLHHWCYKKASQPRLSSANRTPPTYLEVHPPRRYRQARSTLWVIPLKSLALLNRNSVRCRCLTAFPKSPFCGVLPLPMSLEPKRASLRRRIPENEVVLTSGSGD